MSLDTFKQSPIWNEVEHIFKSKESPSRTILTAVIHTPEEDYPALKINTQDILQDYVTKTADIIKLTLTVPYGDYGFGIYKHRFNLEVSIKITYTPSFGNHTSDTQTYEEIRYKAIVEPSNPPFESSDASNYKREELNLTRFIDLKLELIELKYEPLRVKTARSEIFRNITVDKALKSILMNASNDISVRGELPADGISIYPPDNQDTIPNLNIVPGINICDIPTYIQQKVCGIYKYDIGTYFQRYNGKTHWFIYPLYNYERFNSTHNPMVAIFYSTPKQLTISSEKTYRVDSGVVHIVLTSQKVNLNASDLSQLNDGVGIRMADQKSFLNKPVTIKDGNIEGDRSGVNREVGFIERSDGLNYAPIIHDKNMNPYSAISKVSIRFTSPLKVIWENSNHTLLYPGMPIKYYFLEEQKLVELRGVLLAAHTTRVLQGTLYSGTNYVSNTTLLIAVESYRA